MANERRLIDANRALEIVRDQGHEHPNAYHLTNYATLILREAPTVDAVEVIHAKWENVQKGKGCCSNCHRLDSVDSLATHCRYCGAKMDGGNEDG